MLGKADAYQPQSAPAAAQGPTLSVAPDLAITALSPLGRAEVQVLDEYADRTSSTTWQLGAPSLLHDLGNLRVVECRDADVAQAMAADARPQGLCTMLGPTQFAVVPGKEKRLRTALLERGLVLP